MRSRDLRHTSLNSHYGTITADEEFFNRYMELVPTKHCEEFG